MSELWTPAQLAVFARVVELNGFSAAARAYGVPKVAISRAIADLEKSIGVQLMRRTTRGQENPAGGTAHELYPDGFFEVGDGAADGHFGHTVGTRSGGETVQFNHSRENGELGGRP